MYHKFISMLIPIAIPMLTIDLAHAKDFKIGSVKQNISPGSACIAYLPNTQKNMLVIPSTMSKSAPAYAWMNINGKDVRLRLVSVKITQQKKRSISKYRSNNIAVTVDSRQVKEDLGDIVPSTTTKELRLFIT
jgi:hypothetical protein